MESLILLYSLKCEVETNRNVCLESIRNIINFKKLVEQLVAPTLKMSPLYLLCYI